MAAAHRRIERSAFRLPETGSIPETGSDTVDQNIQRTLQRITMLCKRSDTFTQFHARHGCKLLNPDDPRHPVKIHRRRQAWESRVSSSVPQRGHDPRSVDTDKIRLQIDDKLPIGKPVKIKLGHLDGALETSETRQGQTIPRNLVCISSNRRLIFRAP